MENTASNRKTKTALREITFENEWLRVKLIPELGGKITELLNKKTGTQFFRTGILPLSKMKRPEYGEAFLPPFAFGFDECFPSVAPDHYGDNGALLDIPDHGELWTRPWEVDQQPEKLALSIKGNVLDYSFRKEITLQKNRIEIEYHLENTGQEAFDYLWSAHPLLSVEAGDEVFLPRKTEQLKVYGTNQVNIIEGERVNWPELIEGDEPFNVVKEKGSGIAAKLFLEHPEKGTAALYRKKKDESMVVEFDTKTIPHLGLWLCYGGWPDDQNYPADYTIAFEPTTASTDALSEARQRNQSVFIKPGEAKTWNIIFSTCKGKPVDF